MILTIRNEILRAYPGSNRATYLRALAALGVLAIHYGGFGFREIFDQGTFLNKISNNFIDFGGQGPTIFFVASGFVLQKVYGLRFRFSEILMIRYFRLAPAYLLVSAFALFSQKLMDHLSPTLALKKILLLDLFYSDAFLFNPIGIGYFVVIEFWLTFFLILTRFLARKNRNSTQFKFLLMIVLLGSAGISYFSGLVPQYLNHENFHFDVFKYQFFFVFGAVIFELKKTFSIRREIETLIWPISIGILFLDNYLGYLSALIAGLFLLTERSCEKKEFNVFLVIIGNVCYSIYLLHIPLLRLMPDNMNNLQVFFTALVVVCISVVLYLVVETPFMRLSKRLLL